MLKIGPVKPKLSMKNWLMKPAFGERSIFHASAPMNEGSMKGTRNMLFMKVLCGRSVRVTSHAKNVPTMVLPTVVQVAMISELRSAWNVSGSLSMSTTLAKLNSPSAQNALKKIRSTGNATTMTRMAIARNRISCAIPKLFGLLMELIRSPLFSVDPPQTRAG